MSRGEGYFKSFFAISSNQIRKTVVISPIIYPNQLEKALGQKGKQYKSILGYLIVQFKTFTFIKTPMSQAAVADLMVLLEETQCSNVIFMGAMGALATNFKIGDTFLTADPTDIYSFASIHDETDQKLKALKRAGIVGIDFESAVYFKIAKKLKIKAKASYVVTDLPLVKSFYKLKTKLEKKRIKDSLVSLVSLCLGGDNNLPLRH